MVDKKQIIWFVLMSHLFLMACSQNDTERELEVLRVAVLPDQDEQQIRRKYQPLLEHLKSHVDIDSRLLIPASYGELLQWFEAGKIDLAMFGGATYVKARLSSQAVPLVMRDVDDRFRSVVLAQGRLPGNHLEDFKGASIAFGSELSTSGHYMPRYFFQMKGITPETYFNKVQYSGAHDLTAEWVRDGKVDIGVVNSGIVNEMFIDGRLTDDKVRIIWQSPPFADYVWAVQPYVSKEQRTLIRDAFLHMNHTAEDKALLQGLGANYYIPAGQGDFDNLQQVLLQLDRQKVK